MRSKRIMLCQLVGAATLAFALTMTGCAQSDAGNAAEQEATEQEATEQEATDETAEAEADAGAGDTSAFAELDAEIPESAAKIMDATRAVAADPESLEVADIESLPQSEDDSLAVERDDDLEESDGDTSKAPADVAWLTYGGIETLVPTNWFVAQRPDGFDLMSSDGAVTGLLGAIRKEAGYNYDVIAMASSMPQVLQRDYGATNIQVLAYDTLYSDKGTLCDAFIQLSYTIGDRQEIAYYEYVESRSYISFISLVASPDSWQKNWDNGLNYVINSVRFAINEAI